MLKAKDLRDLAVEELEDRLRNCRRELFDMINDLRQSQKTDKPHLMRYLRKDIARLLTVLREKNRV